MRGPDKRPAKRRTPLGAAGLALAAGLVSADIEAHRTRSDAPPDPVAAQANRLRASKPHIVIGPVDRMPKANEVARNVRRMEEALSPGNKARDLPAGIYHKDLNDPRLTEERFGEILDRMSLIASHLMIVRSGVIPDTDSIKQYMPPERIAGVRPLEFTTRDPGAPGNRCHGAQYRYRDKIYEATAAHCVDNTVQESQYRTLKARDFAARDVEKRDSAGSLELNDAMTDDSVEGRVAVVQSENRYNVFDEFHTFVMKMTGPVLSLLKKRYQLSEENIKLLSKSFWFVMPSIEGDRALLSTQVLDIHARGRSGTPPVALVPGMGMVPLAPLTGVIARENVCFGKRDKLCTTIGFSGGPDLLREAAKALARDTEKEGGSPVSDQWWTTTTIEFDGERRGGN